MTKHFENLTPEQRELYDQRANDVKRSPALKLARLNLTSIRKEYESRIHEPSIVRTLAEERGITTRSLYRLLNGK